MKRTKRLVIDSDVARSAGTTEHPISKSCREVLAATLNICHRVVLTEEIRAEWNRHRSRFTVQWLASMFARKKVIVLQEVVNDDLRNRVDAQIENQNERRIMLKDLHLVEAALATDKIIISRDETARLSFQSAARTIGELKPIVWVNPTQEEEQVPNWLQEGAKLDRARQFRAKC